MPETLTYAMSGRDLVPTNRRISGSAKSIWRREEERREIVQRTKQEEEEGDARVMAQP